MQRRRPASLCALLALGLAFITPLLAQDAEDEFPVFRPGLIAHYQAAGGAACRRTDPAIRFDWGKSSPDSRLPAGPFSAHWRGRLFSIEPGDYQLHVYVAGTVELKLNGQTLLKVSSPKPAWHTARSAALTYGHHPLEILYTSATEGLVSELGLFWQGPRFQLEPLPAWHLFHDPADALSDDFPLGQRLVRALRCGACHEAPGEPTPLPAPSLTRLSGNLQRGWLIDWLIASPHGDTPALPERRMPHLRITRPQAEAMADYLLTATAQDKPPETAASNGDAARGERLFMTIGCLACHQTGALGSPSLFGGGDLTRVARKRPASFFSRWLEEPSKINPAHRMPVFKLSDEERADLAAHLQTLDAVAGGAAARDQNQESREDTLATGRELVIAHRCGACHALPDTARQPPKQIVRIHSRSDWAKSCLASPRPEKQQPGYELSPPLAAAVRAYIAELQPHSGAQADGAFVLLERNCVACHARGPEGGIATLLPAVVQRLPELAPELPLLTAPSLLGVGDKLHEEALKAAISTRDAPRRPWLTIRMPKFSLADEELQALLKHFVEHDRIPDDAPLKPLSSLPGKKELAASGGRLVTADGFGCTSCHAIGKWSPKKVALNARGTELSELGSRIRKPWFDRWVRNPARIVPRMEMPSVVTPARKILGENLDHQLAAVWHALNQPDFTPPPPSAIRVVNTTNQRGSGEPAQVLTDVLEVERSKDFEGQGSGKTETYSFVRPLLIAFPNRHNVLVDQETNALAGWWTGDAAQQRTRGKAWYWEPAGTPIWPLAKPESTDLLLQVGSQLIEPHPQGQHVAPVDTWEHVPDGIRFSQRLRFRPPDAPESRQLEIVQTWSALWSESGTATGFRRELEIRGLRRGEQLIVRPLPRSASIASRDGRVWRLTGAEEGSVRLARLDHAELTESGDAGSFALSPQQDNAPLGCELQYLASRAVDTVVSLPPSPPLPALPLAISPGYEAVRLPLAEAEMPTALAWREDGTLIVCSLKGRVCLARDTNSDGVEDQIEPFSDELAAPYGAAAHDGAIDVITKYALLRLHDANKDGRVDRTEVLASGWGHTADYHDWAVGLPRDQEGNYYVALPCQQDERSPAAAHLRGRGLKLAPRSPTSTNPQRYSIEEFCAGLRFPMGLAMNAQGQLFATDNQGNYNPFNELNHLLPGRHYGFINKLEFRPGERPPLEAPAIDVPHPWTRSVNGICFLETPAALRRELGREVFGPHEGHLVGCEYDTRRLIRMSLEQVDGVWQGAAYPFTVEPPEGQEPLQGPVCCEISPAGDLYVGSMRDSGWGAGANVGSIARLRPTRQLPSGIVQVRALPRGFSVEFAQPVDAMLAADTASYAVDSYRRISTPAYGGPDVDRQTHSVRGVKLASDRCRVELELGAPREGFVYELRVKNLSSDGGLFHPAEAHYTLRKAPR